MNRWIQALSCAGVLITASSLSGWGGASSLASKAANPPPPRLSDFPMNPDQQWFTKESYLIMKPYEDDNDYASRLITDGSTSSELSMSMKLEKPDFDWYSGVRLGVGRYLANHDKWDISFFTTYFYAQEKNSSTPRRSRNTLLTPLWSPTFDGGATKGHVLWRLNFFNWDLLLGREFRLLKTVIAHPFIGLRAALIDKDYKASYADQFTSGTIDRKLHDKIKATDHFWGIGPRAGVDFQFNLRQGWSFLGNLSGALFYGRYDVKEVITTHVTNLGQETSKKYRAFDGRYCIRANLDTGLGLGWEKWLHQKTVRIAPSALFEASCWFDTNQLFLPQPSTITNSLSTIPNFSNVGREGNLILMGVSFNLQADF